MVLFKSRRTFKGRGTTQWLLFVLFAIIISSCSEKEDLSGYLFVYFTGNGPGEEQICYAISDDGYCFKALNNNQPIINSKYISSSGGVRDPHILRCEDGASFYMVVTDLCVPKMGWRNNSMVLMKSDDLIKWKSKVINIPEIYPKEFGRVNRVWAPQTIYDKKAGKYMVYFSMRSNQDPDVIYYAYANKDFTGFESVPKQLFYSPTNDACIDADIIEKDGKFYMFFKSENGKPGIKYAMSDQLTGGYVQVSSNRVDKEENHVDGSGVFQLIDSTNYILMYDVYLKGHYQFTRSKDLVNFEIIDDEVSMNFHPRHGSVMPTTKSEIKRLVCSYGTFEDPLFTVTSDQIKQNNIKIDPENKTIHLPVKSGVDISNLDPEIKCFVGFSVEPSGIQDFSKGPVEYTISINGKGSEKYKVFASDNHNPVLPGYKADPEILYAEKTGKYYMYPTSDGYTGWASYQFKVFSSDNMVNWTDEGIILDLKKDITWADRNAWAPGIVEKKINGEYKYFYYYTAAQKIGVAVSDNPTGPFVDKGEPLISEPPEGISWGQQIYPDVFTDPETDKSYLYWGNGYMAVAQLNKDMISIRKETIKVLTPDESYREGTEIFYRNGKYYFMWSEDDTRSPNYKVRYAISDSPLGKLNIPKDNIVIEKRPEEEVYGTGHNSAIQIPGKDEWYLVYHRFTMPKGILMGRAAGYKREVCIDKLLFDEQGKIIPVIPTLEGIDPVK